jgi:hypothetical protein
MPGIVDLAATVRVVHSNCDVPLREVMLPLEWKEEVPMPSPFPGMNPYLEQAAVWQDFHNTFLIAMREVLVRQLLPKYFIRVEEHVYVHEYDSDDRRPLGRPDVSIHESHRTGGATAIADAPASAYPIAVLIPPGADELHSSYLEIRDRENRHVVTTIELVNYEWRNPLNKFAETDREVYWNKVRKVLSSRTHFVEIDLLRGGPRMPWLDLPKCSYYALVSRAETRPRAEVWPVGVRDRLPTVSVPVNSGDAEPTIDLQAILNHVYDSAGYGYSIYDGEPDPQLEPTDAAWAEQILHLS